MATPCTSINDPEVVCLLAQITDPAVKAFYQSTLPAFTTQPRTIAATATIDAAAIMTAIVAVVSTIAWLTYCLVAVIYDPHGETLLSRFSSV